MYCDAGILKFQLVNLEVIRTMLGFVIPLKSQRVSSDWDLVCRNLERTLKSISNQTSDEYRIIIVCNEIPALKDSNPKAEYIQVEMDSVPDTIRQKDSDKARKMWKGLNILRGDDRISHMMLLDADDCISRSLVQFVCSNKSANGWFMNSGFEYPEGSEIIYFRDHDIHYRTGSSHIIRKDLLEKYANIPFERIDIEFLYHQNICSEMQASMNPLEPFPFPGVVYVVEHGENIYLNRKKRFFAAKSFMDLVRIYGGMIRRLFIARSLTEEIRSEFSLYSIH
jgi:glycosyltransferase involved in cell wall biosynthesis